MEKPSGKVIETKEKQPNHLETPIRGLTSVLEKIRSNKIARRIVKTFSAFAAVVGIHYGITRYDVSEKENNGKIEYVHEDPKTAHYLNILSGKDTFGQKDVTLLSVVICQTYAREANINCDLNENSNDGEILSWLDANQEPINQFTGQTISPEETIEENKRMVEEAQKQYRAFFENVDDRQSFYKTMWEIEKECGSPKIRLMPEEKIPLPGYDYNGHYNPVNNTMYINPYEFFYGDGEINIQYISEVAHAKQFDTPVRWVDVCADIVRSFIKAGFNCEKAYSYMIGKPGFYEYDAHEVIEPALEEKLMPSMRVENKELE